jgi:hypothetical protein
MKKLLLALLTLAAGCSESPDPHKLTRAQLGDKWPFTVDYVTVNCDGPSYTVTAPDGKEYALNGTAESIKDSNGRPQYAKLEDIWVKAEIAPGVMGRKDLDAITAVAEACQKGTL